MSKEWLNNIKISQELKDKIYYDEKNDLWVISWNAVGGALTPPTKEEVCKALSKWVKGNIPDIWNYKVYYDREGFHYYNNCDFEEYLVEYEQIGKAITLSVFLPPHLITLIGRFYEELEELK